MFLPLSPARITGRNGAFDIRADRPRMVLPGLIQRKAASPRNSRYTVGPQAKTGAMWMEKLLAVTAIGSDRTGLIKDVSEVISRAGGNIQHSRMIALGSEFAMLVLISGNWHVITRIRERLEALGNDADLTITIRETQPRETMPSAPYLIDIVTLDQEGIVLGISSFFAARNLEIAEMNTRQYNAPHTGATMFSLQFTVNLPATVHVATLRDEFLAYCEEQNLDAIMEPAQR